MGRSETQTKTSAGVATACAPLVPGMFEISASSGKLNLVGSVCTTCGQKVFPARERCPKCFGEALERFDFGRRARLVAFTIVRQAPPGYFGDVPYVLGTVEIEDGIHVLTHLVGKNPEAWRPGDAVQSCPLDFALDPRAEKLGQAFAFEAVTEAR